WAHQVLRRRRLPRPRVRALSPWTRCSSWSLGCATSRRSLPCSCTSLRATPLLPLHRPCRRLHRCPPPRRVVSLFVFVAPLS
uniref:Uncharacterized protein n=1 Tax=Oryza glaberrima TaxID=4538 RepID=I1P399_ORYGL